MRAVLADFIQVFVLIFISVSMIECQPCRYSLEVEVGELPVRLCMQPVSHDPKDMADQKAGKMCIRKSENIPTFRFLFRNKVSVKHSMSHLIVKHISCKKIINKNQIMKIKPHNQSFKGSLH